ncbi:hypothetical protein E1A91_D03G032500v1 [Gossypium mustelinum]|uniref:Uncharacterized protein n=4 Tax=Gossypium TaxID=3633 RepID=A0A5J5S139_GOSBA|nr:hypothetical protein ES319_D03G031800v1 [Gossypium barbadense]TYG75486.1 hypothetical protein ES288_D03G035100v1 [Gossypium darwinii]TYI89124.1 hypothetical protein E1A91_D03G032500v1 [Gossypium mustelinum]
MNHRKVHSQGNIPFSWEDKPGVSKPSKVTHYGCPIDGGLYGDGGLLTDIAVRDNNEVPPPPPCSIRLPPPRRSTSLKGLRWWLDDPFLAAYKECTKSGEIKTGGSKLPVRKKKIGFSCKNACDVRDDNLARLSNLPTLPKRKELVLERNWFNH